MQQPSISDFEALGLRVGTVLRCEPNTGAREPAYKLWLDVGDLGTLQSSAKIVDRYAVEELVGTQVVVVTGFPAIRVGGFRSDALVLGVVTTKGVVLVRPDELTQPGSTIA